MSTHDPNISETFMRQYSANVAQMAQHRSSLLSGRRSGRQAYERMWQEAIATMEPKPFVDPSTMKITRWGQRKERREMKVDDTPEQDRSLIVSAQQFDQLLGHRAVNRVDHTMDSLRYMGMNITRSNSSNMAQERGTPPRPSHEHRMNRWTDPHHYGSHPSEAQSALQTPEESVLRLSNGASFSLDPSIDEDSE